MYSVYFESKHMVTDVRKSAHAHKRKLLAKYTTKTNKKKLKWYRNEQKLIFL